MIVQFKPEHLADCPHPRNCNCWNMTSKYTGYFNFQIITVEKQSDGKWLVLVNGKVTNAGKHRTAQSAMKAVEHIAEKVIAAAIKDRNYQVPAEGIKQCHREPLLP